MPKLITRYGELLVPDTERDIIGRFLSRYGEWAWLEAQFIASVLPDPARVLDVGAFVGTFGLGLAQLQALQSLTCVEANPAICPLLRANIAHHAHCPAQVIEAMVAGPDTRPRPGWSEDGNLGGTSFVVEALPEGPGVAPPAAALTLGGLRERAGPFDLIKLDIEGMELEALSADAPMLSRGQTAIWTECNEVIGSLHLAELLLSWRADIFYFAFPAFNRGNFRRCPSVIFSWAFEAGLLAFPRAPPRLTPQLEANSCILRCIRSVDDLRDALWRTPRWGMPDWPQAATAAEIAALAGRTLHGLSYDTYLRPDLPPPGPAKTLWERLADAEAALAALRGQPMSDSPRRIDRARFRLLRRLFGAAK